jgi:hypothetical protein
MALVVEVLFAKFGSAVAAVTEALFVTVVKIPECSTSVIVAELPALIVPRLHVTVAVPLQDPCEGVAETNVVFDGITSVTVALDELLGPALVTVIT